MLSMALIHSMMMGPYAMPGVMVVHESGAPIAESTDLSAHANELSEEAPDPGVGAPEGGADMGAAGEGGQDDGYADGGVEDGGGVDDGGGFDGGDFDGGGFDGFDF
jgi:hypothetical protein